MRQCKTADEAASYQQGFADAVTLERADRDAAVREAKMEVVRRVRERLFRPNLDISQVEMDAEYARRIPPGEPEEIMAQAISDTASELDAIYRECADTLEDKP